MFQSPKTHKGNPVCEAEGVGELDEQRLYEETLQKALLMLFMLFCVKWYAFAIFFPHIFMDVSFHLCSTAKQHLSSSREHTSAVQPLPSPEPHFDLHCQRRQTRTIGKSNLLDTCITNHIRVVLSALLNAGTKDSVHDCFTA